jgi:hypothetical protein
MTVLTLTAIQAAYQLPHRFMVDWNNGLVIVNTFYSIKEDAQGVPRDFSAERSINRLRMQAYRDAKGIALEYLVRSISGIQVDNQNSIQNILATESYSQERMAELLADRVYSREYPVDFYSARCEAKVRLADIIDLLPFEYPNEPFPVKEQPLKTRYTSLIIDARGLGVKPMLFPSIYDEDGLEIYGRRMVNPRQATSRGLAVYCADEDSASKHAIAGNHPFYTVALRSLRGCPVISHEDVVRVYSHPETRNSLKNCNVILIIEREKLTYGR